MAYTRRTPFCLRLGPTLQPLWPLEGVKRRRKVPSAGLESIPSTAGAHAPLPGGPATQRPGFSLWFCWRLRTKLLPHLLPRNWLRTVCNSNSFLLLCRGCSEEWEAFRTPAPFGFKAVLRGGWKGCHFRSETLRVGTEPRSHSQVRAVAALDP